MNDDDFVGAVRDEDARTRGFRVLLFVHHLSTKRKKRRATLQHIASSLVVTLCRKKFKELWVNERRRLIRIQPRELRNGGDAPIRMRPDGVQDV